MTPSFKIEQDHNRFRQIVRGHVRRNLRNYMADGELIGRQGKDLVSIPVPQIELPHFRFDTRQQGGVGQGEGDVGTPVGMPQPGDGSGPAGELPGQHILEVELTLAELARMLGEELELPRILPKGRRNVEGETVRYTGVRRVGPESLRHFKRTYRSALKRQLASGTYNPAQPAIIPIRDDKRYRSWRTYPRPRNNAVIFYMMDVSGSMTSAKKKLVRLTAFWIDTWLQANYKNLQIRYLVHDAAASEVDRHTFYHLRESGGTRISSAYRLCQQLVAADYDPNDWNLYAFHFSDGENLDKADDEICQNLLVKSLLPSMNLFAYGQVKASYGRQFMTTMDAIENERLVTAEIKAEADIYEAIKRFLGKGY